MSKGSSPRPMEIDREQFGNRFDAIFGKPKQEIPAKPGIDAKLTPHASHHMGAWQSDIITLASTPRFGSVRECRKCQGEHAVTAAGEAMHDELRVPCLYG